jgi:hypothetical protein
MDQRKLDKLEIIVGKVVDVQIIERLLEQARPAPAPRSRRRRAAPPSSGQQPATIIGRQRIFVDGPGAKDPHYDFDRCELAVRRDQEVAFARIRPRRKRDAPQNVMLLNRTMDEAWPFPQGIAALAPPPRIEVRHKALAAAIGAFALLYLLCRFLLIPSAGAIWWIVWPLLAAIVLYFVFWGGLLLYRRPAQEARRRALITALRQKLREAPAGGASAPSHPSTATAAAAAPPARPAAAPAAPTAVPAAQAAQLEPPSQGTAAPQPADPAAPAPEAQPQPQPQPQGAALPQPADPAAAQPEAQPQPQPQGPPPAP